MRVTKHFITVAVLILIVSVFAGILQAGPTIFPEGVTINDPLKAEPMYIFYTARDGITYLIDRAGTEVHTWQSKEVGWGLNYAKPLVNGNISALMINNSLDEKKIVEMDRDSNIVREWFPPADTDPHHDHQILPGHRVLFMCKRSIDRPEISDQQLDDDCLIILNENSEVLWDWQTADHFNEFELSDAVVDGIFAKGGDWAHGNAATMIPPNTPHTDPRFKPGNIVVSFRHISTIAIVDPLTDAIVWTSNLTVGQHHAHMLTDDVPGAGNILVFDNNFGDRYLAVGGGDSSVKEIEPVSNEIVWKYGAVDSGLEKQRFFSHFISSAERLANGNTLICEGSWGRIFEVTTEGEIVWEYITPHFDLSQDPPERRIYRAHHVPLAWF